MRYRKSRKSRRVLVSRAEKLRIQEALKQERFDRIVNHLNHYLRGCAKFVLNNKVVYKFMQVNSLYDLCKKHNLDRIDFSNIYTYINYVQPINILRLCHLNLKEKKFYVLPIIVGCSKKKVLELVGAQIGSEKLSETPSFQINNIELCVYDAIGLNDVIETLKSNYSHISCECPNINRIGYEFFAVNIFICGKNVRFKYSISYRDIWFSTFQADFSKVVKLMLVWFQLIDGMSGSGLFDLFNNDNNSKEFDCKNIMVWKQVYNKRHLNKILLDTATSVEVFEKIINFSSNKNKPYKLGGGVQVGPDYISIFNISYTRRNLFEFVNFLNALGLLGKVLERATYQILCDS